jgi:hypothetical protein
VTIATHEETRERVATAGEGARDAAGAWVARAQATAMAAVAPMPAKPARRARALISASVRMREIDIVRGRYTCTQTQWQCCFCHRDRGRSAGTVGSGGPRTVPPRGRLSSGRRTCNARAAHPGEAHTVRSTHHQLWRCAVRLANAPHFWMQGSSVLWVDWMMVDHATLCRTVAWTRSLGVGCWR